MSGGAWSRSPRLEAEGSRVSVRVGLAGDGSCALAGESVAEAPGLVAGVDDVRAVGEAVNDGLGEASVGKDLRPFAEGQVGGDDQRSAFVAFGEDLEDQLGGAVRQREIAKFVNDDQLGAGVA